MWRTILDAARGRRTSGRPPSPNGASSFHLHWLDLPPALEASVELEVIAPPSIASLYFWALQVSFAPSGGGAHLGLQWNPRHPGSTAVNWGGYERGGSILQGTVSTLASPVDDPNTRTWPWLPQRRYRLRVHGGSDDGWWAGEVTDLATGGATRVRQLAGGGDRLDSVMVWSEVFADCGGPTVAVRWSRPSALLANGRRLSPSGYRVAYQPYERGGCSNTNSEATADGVIQRTATERTTPLGTTIPVTNIAV